MPALYSHTTRANGTVLTATIYNGDHQNHIDNGIPGQLDDYSSNLAQMQSQTSPGGLGTESLPTSLAGEIERLRFIIAQMKNSTYWYTTTAAGGLLGVQVFTSTGTYTPAAGTASVIVMACGGGGGGGSAAATGAGVQSAAQGGGGGAYGMGRFTSSFSGVTVTIGGGGGGGTGAGSGATGGATSFGALMSCPGGIGGSGSNALTAPSFGVFQSHQGATASPSGTNIFGSIGDQGTDGIRLQNGQLRSGKGGSSMFGEGGGVVSVTSDGFGAFGRGGGGGGSANLENVGSNRTGGAGGAGLVVVFEYNH